MDRKIVTVKSYANIAIIKYWGKADAVKMIPATSSISLTLENMFTTTTVSFLPQSVGHDEFYINGVLQDEKEHAKISAIIDQYRGGRSEFVKVETSNNMPTAAGLSSSSSGLSALVKACNELFRNWLKSIRVGTKKPNLLQAHHHVHSLDRLLRGIKTAEIFIQCKPISN